MCVTRKLTVSCVNMWKKVILFIFCLILPGSVGQTNFKEIFSLINGSSHVVDASTKFPAGVLTGHVIDYGNYDECFNNGETTIPTQHCFVHIRFNNVTLPYDIGLKFSYCIPASCPPQILETLLHEIISSPDVNVTVNSDECSDKNGRTVSANDYIGIAVWALFVGLAVLSTLYDSFCRMSHVEKNAVLSSFSLYSNGLRLLNTNLSADTLMPLHGLRFLSICWVILGHRCFLTAFSSLVNLTDLLELVNDVSSQIFIQGLLAVDTFFLLSGLLNSYNLLTLMDKTKRFPAVKYYLHRYIRLTPSLAAIVLMYATWYVLIGDGPHWHHTTGIWKEHCVKNWWPTLLYINNYYNPTSQCAGQSWYLAVDMQLYWLSPFIILPLWKRPKLGKTCLGVLLIVSVSITFAIAYVFEFRTFFNAGFEGVDDFLRTTRLLYVPTHTRATPYVIGLMLGYYLRFLRRNKTILVLSKGLLVLGWLITTLVCLAVVFGNYQFMRPIAEHPYSQIESSLYISLHRVGWGFGVSWIIICCLNKMGGCINDILSWKVFVPLSHLTYCIFLCHMAIQQYNIGTARTPDYFQYFNQIHRFFGDLFLSIVFATVLTLIFESPLMVLEKLYFAKKPNTKVVKGLTNMGFEEDGFRFKSSDSSLPT